MTIGAVVVAAGDSVRMGRHKILLPYNGMTVIEHIVRQLQMAGLNDIVVVTGRDARKVENALETSTARCVLNEHYKDGMLSSVRTGLKALDSKSAGTMICLGDQPGLRAEGVTALRWRAEARPKEIFVPTYRGRRGHPLYIPRRLWIRVLNEFDDVGLRGLLSAESETIDHLEIEAPWILEDIDVPEDYARALEQLKE